MRYGGDFSKCRDQVSVRCTTVISTVITVEFAAGNCCKYSVTLHGSDRIACGIRFAHCVLRHTSLRRVHRLCPLIPINQIQLLKAVGLGQTLSSTFRAQFRFGSGPLQLSLEAIFTLTFVVYILILTSTHIMPLLTRQL